MIGIRNIVDLIRVLVTEPRVERTTLLAADREAISVCELYRAVSRLAGHDPWLASVPPAILEWLLRLTGRRRDTARLLDSFLLNPTIAASQFGWTPPYSLDEELQRTVACELGAFRQAD
jgi:nucleoside-diphosphate-sugar epimerase